MSVLTETEPGRGALGEAGEGGHWSEGHEGGVREGPEGALPGRGRGRRGREAGKNLVQVAERGGGAPSLRRGWERLRGQGQHPALSAFYDKGSVLGEGRGWHWGLIYIFRKSAGYLWRTEILGGREAARRPVWELLQVPGLEAWGQVAAAEMWGRGRGGRLGGGLDRA